MSIKQRIFCIIQLCLAFSLLLWLIFDPFMGEYFRLKSDLILIQNVRGDTALQSKLNPIEKEKLARNKTRFERLSEEDRKSISEGALFLDKELSAPFSQKLKKGVNRFFTEATLSKILWIFSSIFISYFYLKRSEKARSWGSLLPLLTLAYIAQTAFITPEPPFYPSENEIIKNFLKRPISSDILKQREDLLEGWNSYLLHKWGNGSSVEEGEFAFNVALTLNKIHMSFQPLVNKEHPFILLAYLLWNTLFSWNLMKRKYALKTC